MNAALNAGAVQEETFSKMDSEDAEMIICGLSDCIRIELEGVDIVRGRDAKLGLITIVRPAVGESCLIYPFAGA